MRRGQLRGEPLEPIARWERGGDGGEVLLMDAAALTIHLGISDRTVRRYRHHQVKVDTVTGTPLYDADAIGTERQAVRRRSQVASCVTSASPSVAGEPRYDHRPRRRTPV